MCYLNVHQIRKTRTIFPEKELTEIKNYRIVGYFESEKLLEIDFASDALEISNLKVGMWSFVVYGLNGTNIIASSGEEKVEIIGAKTVSKDFHLDYYKVNSNGKFSYTVKIPKNNEEIEKIVFSFNNVDESKTSPEDIIVDNTIGVEGEYNIYSSTKEIPVGNYILTVLTYKKDESVDIISKEALYIISGLESLYEKIINSTGKVSTPILSLKSGIVEKGTKITINCETENSEVYYTIDGSDPRFGKLFTNPILIDKNTLIRTIAVSNNMYNSDEVSCEYHVILPAVFSILPESGTYGYGQEITITSENDGIIYYSLNDEEYREYNNQEKIKLNQNSTLKVFETKDGFDASDVIEKDYLIKASTPTFSIPSGEYSTSQTITISSSSNSTIYYTTDGSMPSVSAGKLYDSEIKIEKTTVIKAIAIKDNCIESEVAEISIVINGSSNFNISTTTIGNLTIHYPEKWGNSTPTVVPGVSAVLEADLSPIDFNAQFSCFLDGNEVAKGKKLTLGTSSQNICLGVGNHVISCIATCNKNRYSASYEVNVSRKNNIGKAGPTYLVGMNGPAGGYIFYDCDADNTVENPCGPDGLRSDICGWRFLETTKCLISTYFGVFYDENEEAVILGTKKEIGTGKSNTKLLVEATKKYKIKNCYDSTEYISDESKLAAVYIDNYELNGYNDWFLPSYDELYAIYDAWFKDMDAFGGGTKSFIVTNNRDFWSSSEDSATAIMSQVFFTSQMISRNRHSTNSSFVFAVRSFL